MMVSFDSNDKNRKKLEIKLLFFLIELLPLFKYCFQSRKIIFSELPICPISSILIPVCSSFLLLFNLTSTSPLMSSSP